MTTIRVLLLGMVLFIAGERVYAELSTSQPPVIPYEPDEFNVGQRFIDGIVPMVGECMVLKIVKVSKNHVSGKWLAVTCPPLKREEP